MWAIRFMQSFVGRVLNVAAGAWLLFEGSADATLGGLITRMAGVVLMVTAFGHLTDESRRREHRL